MRAITLMVGLLTACLATGCGDDETGGSGGGGTTGGCRDYAEVSGSPSFANDVIPVFALSCALSSSCHQIPAQSAQEGLALGLPMSMLPLSQADLDTVHDLIVGGAAQRSQLPLVDPGNPAGSWLMAKIEYGADANAGTTFDDCSANSQCQDCGVLMPQNGARLDADRRDTVAAWIKDGAPNN